MEMVFTETVLAIITGAGIVAITVSTVLVGTILVMEAFMEIDSVMDGITIDIMVFTEITEDSTEIDTMDTTVATT